MSAQLWGEYTRDKLTKNLKKKFKLFSSASRVLEKIQKNFLKPSAWHFSIFFKILFCATFEIFTTFVVYPFLKCLVLAYTRMRSYTPCRFWLIFFISLFWRLLLYSRWLCSYLYFCGDTMMPFWSALFLFSFQFTFFIFTVFFLRSFFFKFSEYFSWIIAYFILLYLFYFILLIYCLLISFDFSFHLKFIPSLEQTKQNKNKKKAKNKKKKNSLKDFSWFDLLILFLS